VDGVDKVDTVDWVDILNRAGFHGACVHSVHLRHHAHTRSALLAPTSLETGVSARSLLLFSEVCCPGSTNPPPRVTIWAASTVRMTLAIESVVADAASPFSAPLWMVTNLAWARA
jgi:hypothetical protein